MLVAAILFHCVAVLAYSNYGSPPYGYGGQLSPYVQTVPVFIPPWRRSSSSGAKSRKIDFTDCLILYDFKSVFYEFFEQLCADGL
ncbi:unnamed protein product [Heligmosomoides polygyrus]|uniref:Secreted protein n=1 Tax=Heligmosomoides polygyrus TaxID=6339 RepID=A0A183F1V3_HELPZ|nr:unnamed protein product [Heligmosomoides polygyrus]